MSRWRLQYASRLKLQATAATVSTGVALAWLRCDRSAHCAAGRDVGNHVPAAMGASPTLDRNAQRTPALFALHGKVALVTGSSKGLGRGMAQGLAEAGAHVVVNSRNEAECLAAARELEAEGYSASACAFDVTDEQQVVAAVARIQREQGRIDVLVNNAGGTRRAPFLEQKSEDWDHVVRLNMRGPYLLSRECAKVMALQESGGRIINICSVLSVLGRSTIQAYTATKHALVGMTKGLATELGPMGILVNGIGPGYFVTELTKPLMDDPKWNKFVCTRTPVGRWGTPDDLKGACVFLASPASSYINGHVLMVDGGMTVACTDSLLQ